MKEQMMDIVMYVNPTLSLCIFVAWMHCVWMDSMAYCPVYFVAGILALLINNYIQYGIDEDFNFGFSQITMSELLKVLIWGGPGTKYIKPIKVTRHSDLAKTARVDSSDALDEDGEDALAQNVFSGSGCFKMDGDHMEFPFSEAGRYPKKTLSEACVDASAMFSEEDEEETKKSGTFSSKCNLVDSVTNRLNN